ncbi:hypothetical protein SAMN05421853_12317 [Roseivivax halotolerans]|uniref:Uncharacterized protein n=1 Tax=Roseivivax halotolerans TaxID=93684 RepID=A0A1I6AKH0_9RHOB|nr:hypothetical protein [Roseivivax halotolerans]SFQ69221.1 hypothetical protein SAMN05421853_12317 [Roseivivax halotolerans]
MAREINFMDDDEDDLDLKSDPQEIQQRAAAAKTASIPEDWGGKRDKPQKERRSKPFSCRVRPSVLEAFQSRLDEEGITSTAAIEKLMAAYGEGRLDIVPTLKMNSDE